MKKHVISKKKLAFLVSDLSVPNIFQLKWMRWIVLHFFSPIGPLTEYCNAWIFQSNSDADGNLKAIRSFKFLQVYLSTCTFFSPPQDFTRSPTNVPLYRRPHTGRFHRLRQNELTWILMLEREEQRKCKCWKNRAGQNCSHEDKDLTGRERRDFAE